MSAPSRFPTGRQGVVAVVAAVVLVVGMGVLAVGLRAGAEARSDRDAAEAALVVAQAERDAADTALTRVRADMDDVRAEHDVALADLARAESTLGQAQARADRMADRIDRMRPVLVSAQDLCDCEADLARLVGDWRSALQAEDASRASDALGQVVAYLDAHLDQMNEVSHEIRDVLAS